MNSTRNPPRKPPPQRLRFAGALVLVFAAMVPATLPAQVGAGVARTTRLEVTSTSAEARTALTGALEDISGIFPGRATLRLRRAVELDPGLGLARVMLAITAPGMTAAERNEEIARGMTDVARASPGEQLIATAYRESFRQNVAGARSILLSAATLMPDEPWIAWQRAMMLANLPGGVATDPVPALRTVVERFPDFAPAYNNLSYGQWRAGARGEALRTAATYMAKAPAHPKSHDTYAELQQWNGNYGEAAAHYAKAVELDPTFLAGHHGLAEALMLQGKGDQARQTLTAAVAHTATPQERVGMFSRIANSYVLEGNIKAAMTALGTVIQEAQQGQLTGPVANAHLSLMFLEAGFGDPKAVSAHIGHIAALPPPAAGAAPPNPAARYLNYGMAYAIAGQAAQARVYLDSLTRHAQAMPGPTVANQVHGLTGWVLYSEGKFAEALTEFRQDNPEVANVRAGIALAQFKLGNIAEARSIRDELVTDRNLNLANGANLFARRLVKVRIT